MQTYDEIEKTRIPIRKNKGKRDQDSGVGICEKLYGEFSRVLKVEPRKYLKAKNIQNGRADVEQSNENKGEENFCITI